MCKLIPIQYNSRIYPKNITPKMQEVAGHLDKQNISPRMEYSLHTEYSYTKRKLQSPLIADLSVLKNSHENGIPQLWFNDKWSCEFIEFVHRLVNSNRPPTIIEIHPPFDDYCSNIQDFVERYTIFEKGILDVFKKTKIVIENRYGSRYKRGKFLISDENDLITLVDFITDNNLKLKIVLDVPQLLSAKNLSPRKISCIEIKEIFSSLKSVSKYIIGIHIWGKKDYGNGKFIAHMGNLDDYFMDNGLKNVLLQEIFKLFDDGVPRLFVPEVNSDDSDLRHIVLDFINAGFEFL